MTEVQTVVDVSACAHSQRNFPDKEDCDESSASEDFDGGALEELEEMGADLADLAHDGTRPAAGSLSDQDRPQSDRSNEQEQEQEQEQEEEQEEQRDQHGTGAEELEEEEEAKEEDEENEEEFRELSAAASKNAVQLGEGAESVRGTGKIELEFHLQGPEEAEHSVVSGILSAEASQAPGCPNRSEERDEDEEEAEPEQEAMVAEELEEPKAKRSKPKKAKKAKRTPAAAQVPQVKTRIEILPPVRLPALTRRNRKNTVANLKSVSLFSREPASEYVLKVYSG